MTYVIDPSLLESTESGESLPYLVASDYAPRTLDDELFLCLPTECLEKLGEGAQEIIRAQCPAVSVVLGRERQPALNMSGVEWAMPARPARGFVEDKVSGQSKIRRQVQGEEWTKNMKSVNRLLLICVIDGDIITDDSGTPHLFTLNLGGSNRAKWIYDSKEFGGRHIDGLNTYWLEQQKKELAKANIDVSSIKANSWVLHLCSIAIRPVPYEVEYEGVTNIRARFQFVPGAQPHNLSPGSQKTISDFVRGSEFQELKKDPFGVDRKQVVEAPQSASDDMGRPMDSYEDDRGPAKASYDDIPF